MLVAQRPAQSQQLVEQHLVVRCKHYHPITWHGTPLVDTRCATRLSRKESGLFHTLRSTPTVLEESPLQSQQVRVGLWVCLLPPRTRRRDGWVLAWPRTSWLPSRGSQKQALDRGPSPGDRKGSFVETVAIIRGGRRVLHVHC